MKNLLDKMSKQKKKFKKKFKKKEKYFMLIELDVELNNKSKIV